MKFRYVALVVLLIALFPGPMADLCQSLAQAVIGVADSSIDAPTAVVSGGGLDG